MPLYEQEAMWVDDDTSYAIDKDIPIEVKEEDVTNVPMVVEEPIDKTVPGSNVQLLDDKPAPVKETNWADDGDHSKAIGHLETMLNNIPKHSGNTIPGCERAKSYIKSAINEGLKMIRTDVHGKIDELKIEAILKKAQEMIERLDNRIQQLRGGKKASVEVKIHSTGSCEKCGCETPMWHDIENNKMVCLECEAAVDDEGGLEKTAGTAVVNMFITAFERAVVGTLLNASISGGKNIEDMYNHLKDKYDFTPREELSIQQILMDSGCPLPLKDRALINEPQAENDSQRTGELPVNYYA